MSNISIGVTAMELFAYNPFRILGIAVNTPNAQIDKTYSELMRLADSGEIGAYKTPFDFDSLPPFSRSAQTLKTAYAKLSSNGYRCFAYSDSEFSVSLNIDDIALNLRDITCYDCFLRCYMWLIINDRDMQERDLWIQLAKYIDKLILSSPEEWTKYFDNRFPDEMVDRNMTVYKSFYSTFCQIILLPLKEMVRGSMKCSTAEEILRCAKIDLDEQFEFIEIPQANVPKPGEPEPKLKIALKDGEEYFDIKTGTMKSYSTDAEAAESNSFAEAANAPLEAEVLAAEEPEELPEEPEEYAPDEEEVSEEAITREEPSVPEPQAESAPEPEIREEAAVEEPEPQTEPENISRPAPRRPERRAPEHRVGERKTPVSENAAKHKAPPKPTEPVAPKPEPLKLDKEQSAETARPARQAPSPARSEAAPKRSMRTMRTRTAEESAPKQSAGGSADFNSSNPFFNPSKQTEETPKQTSKRVVNGYTKLVKEAEKKEEERAAASLNELEEEEDENLYTNALIEMLRSNQSRGETMRSVDTRHVKNGDMDLNAPAPTAASMDSINMSKYDDKLLASPYEMTTRKLTREERYRNVKIDDMLNPGGVGKNFAVSAIDEYKKKKEKEKQNRRTILTLTGIFALCLIVFLVMYLGGII